MAKRYNVPSIDAQQAYREFREDDRAEALSIKSGVARGEPAKKRAQHEKQIRVEVSLPMDAVQHCMDETKQESVNMAVKYFVIKMWLNERKLK